MTRQSRKYSQQSLSVVACETATWHLCTEEAIERQLAWLEDEDVIDEDDTSD